jgi:hypothetical protein
VCQPFFPGLFRGGEREDSSVGIILVSRTVLHTKKDLIASVELVFNNLEFLRKRKLAGVGKKVAETVGHIFQSCAM